MSDNAEIIEPTAVVERDGKGRFIAGNTGNGGRPRGSRNKLASEFISAFERDFAQHGPRVIEQVRIENPAIWLKVCGDLLPKDLERSLDPGAEFRALETPEEIWQLLARRMVEDSGVDDALAQLGAIRDGVLAIASEQAQLVS